jgi:hypothetical protein
MMKRDYTFSGAVTAVRELLREELPHLLIDLLVLAGGGEVSAGRVHLHDLRMQQMSEIDPASNRGR